MLLTEEAGARATLMCTGDGFPTRAADSIGGLQHAYSHPAFAPDGWPQWADGGFWAPDLERVAGRYLLFYSVKRKGDHRRCIAVAISDRPDGGFRDVGHPLVTNDPEGAIDPALLQARGGLYLIYKRDGNAFRHPSIIYGLALDPTTLDIGPRAVLLRSRPGGWEQGVAEGPTAITRGTTTFLLYSGGYYLGAGYAQGEAIRRGSPLGPYQRIGDGPVLQGNRRWAGTGGGSIVDGQGRLLLAYNAFPARERQPKRRLFVRPLRLVGEALWPAGRAKRIPLLA
jgi:beta-xylosidase